MSAVVEYGRIVAVPDRWQKVRCHKCNIEGTERSMLPIISYTCKTCEAPREARKK